jgi:hypothetical protein
MGKLNRRGRVIYGASLAAAIVGLGIGQAMLQTRAVAENGEVQAPRFEVDPFWPKPLPNRWLLGAVIGVWADEQDHIWIIHRSSATLHNNEKGAELNPPIAECCRGARPRSSFATRCIASNAAMTVSSMFATAPTTACRCSTPTASS